jgi:ribosomal protein L12E/L44/L45/RPP1/RPP2
MKDFIHSVHYHRQSSLRCTAWIAVDDVVSWVSEFGIAAAHVVKPEMSI